MSIDLFVPVVQRNAEDVPLFAHSDRHELWVILLEKAYAKLHKSYAAIVGGSPLDAYLTLTGCYCLKIALSEV